MGCVTKEAKLTSEKIQRGLNLCYYGPFCCFFELPTVLFNLKRSVHVRSYKLRDLAVIQSVINTELLKVVVVSVFRYIIRNFHLYLMVDTN